MAARPGAHLRIIEEDHLQSGGEIDVVHGPDHEVTMRLVFQAILLDRALIAQALPAPQLPQSLREWMAGSVDALDGALPPGHVRPSVPEFGEPPGRGQSLAMTCPGRGRTQGRIHCIGAEQVLRVGLRTDGFDPAAALA